MMCSGLLNASSNTMFVTTVIFEKSSQSSEVPTDWKRANIIHIFKKGEKEDPRNYRTVSLTSVPRQIIEQILLETMLGHLENKELIGGNRHGFTKGNSCLNKFGGLLPWSYCIGGQGKSN